MYSDDPGPSINQVNAKSCIQALLKNREQNSLSGQSSATTFFPDLHSGNLRGYTEIGNLKANFESSQDPTDQSSNKLLSPEDRDNTNDFNYSQKLFHIDDGNLYSIFSPIQGRSYGMKPSFLRKQKYTVQECHSRGRKNLRKGLKFHNFLPSESTTSEKDNGYLRTKWKVHSECRLREEHGTKQITISNWSHSIQNQSNGQVNPPPKPSSKIETPSVRTRTGSSLRQSLTSKFAQDDQQASNGIQNGDVYDFNLSLQNTNLYENDKISATKSSSESSTTVSKSRDSLRSVASKKDSLSFVVNSLLDKPEVFVKQSQGADIAENHSKTTFYHNQKHRRKPVQTRRVVPYVKYLSIMEENDSVPLDLSSKCLSDSNLSQSGHDLIQSVPESNAADYSNLNYLLNEQFLLKPQQNATSTPTSSLNSHLSKSVTSNDNHFTNSPSLEKLLRSQVPMPVMVLSSPINNNVNVRPSFMEPSTSMQHGIGGNINGKLALPLNAKAIKIKSSFPPPNMSNGHSSSNNMQFGVHKSFIKESQARTRRRNQRSVIKQKLEDTFRQNGFLVKTKQVSDGEATFCKFRQLRKYTRYYLKSWQQHLPDEVNKMWKGFLPPKTVLPAASGSNESVNTNAML